MVKTVTPREAQALVKGGLVDVIDVREPSEWQTGHVPGARLVPLGSYRADPDAANIKSPALFVCAKGGRSLAAAEIASSRGVAEVYSMDGGTNGWIAEGLEVVRPAPPPAPPAPAVEAPFAGEVCGMSSSASMPAAAPVAAIPEPPPSEREAVPDLDAVVGDNVKRLRTQRGYSLDVLAGLSGVGRQTLGQIELGRSVPSVATLWKIAKAFDVPFSILLERTSRATTSVLRGPEARRLVSADGRFSSRALFPPGRAGKTEFYELWLAGYSREDAEAHAAGTHENLVVTAGRLVLEMGDERYELKKGDAIAFLADTPHAYVNPGAEECWMYLVMTYG